MVISGSTSLGMPLNLEDPAYLEHVSSVFIFYLRVYEQNWPLCLGPLQFLDSSLYWYSGTIQSLSYLYQVNQLILASGSVTDQGTKESPSSLYNPPHRGESILYTDPSTFSDHLITTIVYIPPSGAWFDPSGAEYYICIDSCFSSSEKKPWTYWLPLGDNHSSKSWPSCPSSWNSHSIRFGSFYYLLIHSFNTLLSTRKFCCQGIINTSVLIIPWQHNFFVYNRSYSLMYELSCR